MSLLSKDAKIIEFNDYLDSINNPQMQVIETEEEYNNIIKKAEVSKRRHQKSVKKK